MARRELLTEAERQALFGVPAAREDLARHYMLSTNDLALVAARRGAATPTGWDRAAALPAGRRPLNLGRMSMAA